jgi:hypothetical protein
MAKRKRTKNDLQSITQKTQRYSNTNPSKMQQDTVVLDANPFCRSPTILTGEMEHHTRRNNERSHVNNIFIATVYKDCFT